VGQFSDLESTLAFRDLLHKLNCENIDVRSNAPSFKADFRSQYLFNSKVRGIDDTDLLILIGTNPRSENPVLNARIRKSV
jgi:NADH dehydrogenase/NADH:ubiquinone oxidoreductase subunit G